MTPIHRIRKTQVLATSRGMDVVIVSKDDMGALFLSTLVRVNDRELRYLGIAIDKARLEQVKKGELSLRDAFVNRQGCWIDGYAKSPIQNNIDSKVRNGDIPEAYLPPNLRLRPAVDRDITHSLTR
jgi:hypothetical protein